MLCIQLKSEGKKIAIFVCGSVKIPFSMSGDWSTFMVNIHQAEAGAFSGKLPRLIHHPMNQSECLVPPSYEPIRVPCSTTLWTNQSALFHHPMNQSECLVPPSHEPIRVPCSIILWTNQSAFFHHPMNQSECLVPPSYEPIRVPCSTIL